MSAGYARLFALPRSADSDGFRVPLFQFTFNAGGNAYSKVLAETQLVEFLTEGLGLRADVTDTAVDQLRSLGNATIADVKLSENDAAALGMEEVGADY
jgi:hypothetical protein